MVAFAVCDRVMTMRVYVGKWNLTRSCQKNDGDNDDDDEDDGDVEEEGQEEGDDDNPTGIRYQIHQDSWRCAFARK